MATQTRKKSPERRLQRASPGLVGQRPGDALAVQIGTIFGSINKARASQAVKALEKIGLIIDKPATRRLPPGIEFAAKPTRRIRNRISLRTPDDVDLHALEAKASHKALEFRQLLLRNALTVTEARKQLGVASSQTVHNWVKQKKLLALPDRHRIMLPKWQFDPNTVDGVVDGLQLVLKAMNGNPFGIAHWLTARNSHLQSKAPIELLRQGNVASVVEEARGLGLGQ